ncbi:MAG: SpoIIE family protein phosphatase [Ignavibacteriales bacterium]|nr:SpoIIE family protein phosphatase [Ignavibacteriales bacterium]
MEAVRHRLVMLERILEATQKLNSTLDLNVLLRSIVETTIQLVDADRGTLYLIDEKKNELWSQVLTGEGLVDIRLPMGTGIAGYVAESGETLNIRDAYAEPRFYPDVDRKSGYVTKSILCMPLENRDGKIIGVFELFNKKKGFFSKNDETVISIMSVHVAIAIENSRLHKAEIEFVRINEEVRLAAVIQNGLLPKSSPSLPGYEIAGISIPAQSVGGDYFDFIPMIDGRVALCLGDVSGKGLPASLLMANLQATLRGQTLVSHKPSECLFRSNKLLYESTTPEKFATLFYGILEIREHTLHYSNAGHEWPFLVGTDHSIQRLQTGGLMLGLMPHVTYEDIKISLRAGDLLVIQSDGVSEAMNANQELFGEQRLQNLILEQRDRSPREIIDAIVREVHNYAGENVQSDDITIMVVKRIL